MVNERRTLKMQAIDCQIFGSRFTQQGDFETISSRWRASLPNDKAFCPRCDLCDLDTAEGVPHGDTIDPSSREEDIGLWQLWDLPCTDLWLVFWGSNLSQETPAQFHVATHPHLSLDKGLERSKRACNNLPPGVDVRHQLEVRVISLLSLNRRAIGREFETPGLGRFPIKQLDLKRDRCFIRCQRLGHPTKTSIQSLLG